MFRKTPLKGSTINITMQQLAVWWLLISCMFVLASTDLVEDENHDIIMPVADGNWTLIRGKRDGYGGYGGYGGGCSCPYNSCGDKTDGLVAFGLGALVGLLFALLRALTMPPTTGPGGRSFSGDFTIFNYLSNLQSASDDIMPFLSDLAMVYINSDHNPQCVRQWFCEMTKRAAKKGGIRDRLATLSSAAYGWYTQDTVPIAVNRLRRRTVIKDCENPGQHCDVSFLNT